MGGRGVPNLNPEPFFEHAGANFATSPDPKPKSLKPKSWPCLETQDAKKGTVPQTVTLSPKAYELYVRSKPQALISSPKLEISAQVLEPPHLQALSRGEDDSAAAAGNHQAEQHGAAAGNRVRGLLECKTQASPHSQQFSKVC